MNVRPDWRLFGASHIFNRLRFGGAMRVFLFFLFSLYVIPAYADSCSSVIAGASTSGYEGKYGSYSADGSCHSRDTSNESECRRLTGGLFRDFVPDRGANFTECIFALPGGGSSSASPGGSGPAFNMDVQVRACNRALADLKRDPSDGTGMAITTARMNCARIGRPDILQWIDSLSQRNEAEGRQREAGKACDQAILSFETPERSFYPVGPDSRMLLGNLEANAGPIDKWCPLAGRPNLSVWAHSEIRKAADALEQYKIREAEKARIQSTLGPGVDRALNTDPGALLDAAKKAEELQDEVNKALNTDPTELLNAAKKQASQSSPTSHGPNVCSRGESCRVDEFCVEWSTPEDGYHTRCEPR